MPKDPPPFPRRKPGAKPGNTNALKHGFYARGLLRREKTIHSRRWNPLRQCVSSPLPWDAWKTSIACVAWLPIRQPG